MIGLLTAERGSGVTAKTGTLGTASASPAAGEATSRGTAPRRGREDEAGPTHLLPGRGHPDRAEATTRSLREETEGGVAAAATGRDERTDRATREETIGSDQQALRALEGAE